MQLLIDVYDASGNRLGEGPVTTVQGVTVLPELSGVGSLSFAVPVADERALDLLTNERRIKVQGWDVPGSAKRLIGSGIVRNFAFTMSEGGDMASYAGPDSLDELKRKNTWLGWTRNLQSISSIVSDLVALVPGWTADTSGLASYTNLISVRFDGVSVLKALQAVVEQQGVHFRLGGDKLIEFGPFGDDSGLRVNQITHAPPDLLRNDNLLLLDQLTLTYDSEQVVNRIVVLGPGDGEAALTLKLATRTTPYTVQSMVVNDLTLYYIEDTDSIAEFGVIERTFTANNIAALSNNTADIVAASNALYDLASAWLTRNSVLQQTYKVPVRKARATIKPGQKVRVDWRGWAVNPEGKRVKWINVADDLWVVRLAEKIGLAGASVDLDLSTVDKVPGNEADVVIGSLEQMRVKSLIVKPYLSKDTINPPAEAIDSTHDVEFPITFGDYTAKLNQVIFRLQTRPFRTLASGGDHNHRMFAITSPTGFPGTALRPLLAKDADGGSTLFCKFETNSAVKDVWTESSSGDLDFGIADDTETPESITIYVDDQIVTSGLAPSGGNQNEEYDITQFFSETGFQGSHTIKITCESGQGQVIGEIEMRETIQSIAVI